MTQMKTLPLHGNRQIAWAEVKKGVPTSRRDSTVRLEEVKPIYSYVIPRTWASQAVPVDFFTTIWYHPDVVRSGPFMKLVAPLPWPEAVRLATK